MSKKLKLINGVELVNKFKKRKIGKDCRLVLVLAKCGEWEAQLGLEVYSYGQVFIVWKTECKGEHQLPKPLGTCAIKQRENLIQLVDVVSQVMCEGLGKKRCEKVYLASLNESKSSGLHFHLIPRPVKDKKLTEKISGFFLISDYVREYLSRSNDCRTKKCCVSKESFVPFKLPRKNGNCNSLYKKYVGECQKWFEKGWKRAGDRSI